jgi:hypothetical protein
MVAVADDANAGDQIADEARLRLLAIELADGVEGALPGWVERCVARIVDAWPGQVDPSVSVEAVVAGAEARSEVGPEVRRLLMADIDDQRTNPMAIIRGAVAYPTGVLQRAGISGVVRDAEAVRQFPADDYDLTPTSFADLDPSLHEVGLAWGAAKAFVFKARRRAEGHT